MIETTFEKFISYAKLAYEYNSNRVVTKTIINKDTGLYVYSNRDIIECSIFGGEKFQKRYGHACPIVTPTEESDEYASHVDEILTHHRFLDSNNSGYGNNGNLIMNAKNPNTQYYPSPVSAYGTYGMKVKDIDEYDSSISCRERRKNKKFPFVDIVNHSQHIGHVSKKRFGVMSWIVVYAEYIKHLHDRQAGASWKLYKNTSKFIPRLVKASSKQLNTNPSVPQPAYTDWHLDDFQNLRVTIFKRHTRYSKFSKLSSIQKIRQKTKVAKVNLKKKLSPKQFKPTTMTVRSNCANMPYRIVSSRQPHQRVPYSKKNVRSLFGLSYSSSLGEHIGGESKNKFIPQRLTGKIYTWNYYSGYTDKGDLVHFKTNKWLEFDTYDIKCKIKGDQSSSHVFDGAKVTVLINVKIVKSDEKNNIS